MHHYLGLDDPDLRYRRTQTPVNYSPSELINGHLLLCGMSGTGKSFQALRLLNSAAKSGLALDVFDVHDELSDVTGSVACTFSQHTQYGINPLALNSDKHTGGVDTQINFLISLVRENTAQFGSKQEAALRYLLRDVYATFGIYQNKPSTWHRKNITEATRLRLIETNDLTTLHRNHYPTMSDLLDYTRRKIITLTVGGDNPSMGLFDALSKQRRKLHRLLKTWDTTAAKLTGSSGHIETENGADCPIETLRSKIGETSAACKQAFCDFIDSLETGRETDDILKYDSSQTLTSVLHRLTLITGSGIFSATPAPFDKNRPRIHQLKSISTAQQVMYVKLRLQAIFDQCKRNGRTDGNRLRHVIFLDEAHKYFSSDPDDIINVISKEARKFGLALWCASQEPTSFPESFLTNCGTTLLLGIHTSYWKKAAAMFRITEETLSSIRPKEVMSIKTLRDGEIDPPFRNIIVPNQTTKAGRIAHQHQQGA